MAAARNGRGTARRSRRRGGAARSSVRRSCWPGGRRASSSGGRCRAAVGVVRRGAAARVARSRSPSTRSRSRNRSAWKIERRTGAIAAAATCAERRRDQRLVPADDRRRAVGARLEGDQAAAGERPLVGDREACRWLEFGDGHRVGRRDAEDADRRLAARPDPDRSRRQHADGLHLVHPARLALDVREDVPDALDRRIDDDQAADRLGRRVAARAGEQAVDDPRDAQPDDREADRREEEPAQRITASPSATS